jgi:hypothetical protein
MAYYLSDRFNSQSIEYHYREAKTKAVAFLMTVGAKALILAEQQVQIYLEAGPVINREAINGLKEEAELKLEIQQEERIRSFRRKLSEKLHIYKIGRNGQRRGISVKIRHDKVHNTALVWKSQLGGKKHFELHKSLKIDCLQREKIKSKESCILVLLNENRNMQIQFSTYEETVAFLYVVFEFQPSVQLSSILMEMIGRR